MLPEYLVYGMTADEYWNESPLLAKAYREAFELKQEKANYDMWWQGVYFYEAISTVHYNENRKKGQRAINYPEKPHNLQISYNADDCEHKDLAKREREKAIKSLTAWKKAWDENGNNR